MSASTDEKPKDLEGSQVPFEEIMLCQRSWPLGEGPKAGTTLPPSSGTASSADFNASVSQLPISEGSNLRTSKQLHDTE